MLSRSRIITYKWSKYIVKTKSPDRAYILLFNTRSGALLRLPKEIAPKLSFYRGSGRLKNGFTEKRLFNALFQGAFIVESSLNELEEIHNAYSRQIERSIFHLSIMPTMKCNMACSYCFEQSRNVSMNKSGVESLLRFIDIYLPSTAELSVDWYGGEPLLKADFIISLQNRLKRLCDRKRTKSTFSMTTNGYLLNQKTCDSLVSAGVESFQITIDGPEKIHNSRRCLKGGKPTFHRVVSNVSYAADKATVNIRVNIDRANVAHMEELITSLSYYGLQKVQTLSFKAVVPAGGNNRSGNFFSMPEFAEVIQGIIDKATSEGFNVYLEPRIVGEFCVVELPNQWIVGPDLYVYKCADNFNPKEDSVGRIVSDGTLHLRENLNVWHRKPIFDDPKCRECVYLPQCMGGCALKKMVHGKDWCPEERFALPAYVQRLYQSSVRNN